MINRLRRRKPSPTPSITERRQRIYSFLKDNPIGVLSSFDPAAGPHGVVIYYTIDEHFNTSFLTRVETRKHHNLKQDNRVMLTVYEPHTQTTAQITGEAFEVSDSYDVNTIAKAILEESLKTSAASTGMMPITKLRAGPYTAFTIHPEQVRMAVYTRPDPGDYSSVFESLESYELDE